MIEHVTSTLVTMTTTATFASFENVSQLKVKECIFNSSPTSYDPDPIQTLNRLNEHQNTYMFMFIIIFFTNDLEDN